MHKTFDNLAPMVDRVIPAASLHVEIIADLVCPFCYIGKRRFDKALDAVKGPTDVSWYPYQLNSDVPREGMPLDQFLTRRFGNLTNVDPVLDHLISEGEDVGIEFRFDRMRHVPNTLKVHQLMQLAENRGKNQSALAEDLMSAFFEQGLNIGEKRVLIEIAASHGLSAAEVAGAYDSEHLQKIVLSRESQAKDSGLAGIPGFLINRRLLIVGAQTSDTMVNAFDRAMFGEGTDELLSPALN